MFLRRLNFAISLLLISTSAAAQGGPPIRTDDPGTPGDNKWEINFGISTEQSAIQQDFEIPTVDFNYGVGGNVQLKYEVPFAVSVIPGQGTSSGIGYSRIGVKWRFVDEEKSGVAVSIYPQVIFNSPVIPEDKQDREGTQLLLPVEVSKSIKSATVMGEAGYNFSQKNMGEWLYAFALAYPVTPRVEILGEIRELVKANFKDDEMIVNAGTRIKINDKLLLMLSAGHTVRNFNDEKPKFIMYVGMRYLP